MTSDDPGGPTTENPEDPAFGRLDPAVISGEVTTERAVEVARSAVQHHYPDARYAFLYGSAAFGRFKPFSDLDILVVTNGEEKWSGKYVNHEGFLVEFQVYTHDSVDVMFAFAQFSGTMLGITAGRGSVILIDEDGEAASLQRRLEQAMADGPNPRSEDFIARIRVRLTSLELDLRSASGQDAIAIGLTLYEPLTKLVQALDNQWMSLGAWVARNADRTRPGLFPALTASYVRLLHDEDPSALLQLVDDLLGQAGGRLWTGVDVDYALGQVPPLIPLIEASQTLIG